MPGSLTTFAATGSAASARANVFKYTLTSTPAGSTLAVGPLKDVGGNDLSSFTPDVSGDYTFNVSAYLSQAARPSFAGDRGGAAYSVLLEPGSFRVIVGVVDALAILNASGSGATLQLVVSGGAITAASLVNATDDAALAAINDESVQSALTSMLGEDPADIDLDFATDVRAMQDAYEAHRLNVGEVTIVHQAADTVNVLTAGHPYSTTSAIAALGELIDRFSAHEADVIAHVEPDTKNPLLAAKSAALAGAIVAKADVRSRYIRHLAQVATPEAHEHADATNTLSAPRPLPALVAAYFNAIASTAVLPPVGFTRQP